MKRDRIAFVLNIRVFGEIFLIILQKTAAKGPDKDIKAY